MKRIKLIIFSVFLITAMLNLTACRNKNGADNMTTQNASQSGSSNAIENTSAVPSQTATDGINNNNNTNVNESSTGAVNGVMDDIENGIDHMTETTSGAQG